MLNILNMKTVKSQESVTYHIGPEVICSDVDIVKNEINLVCCKCSKKAITNNKEFGIKFKDFM